MSGWKKLQNLLVVFGLSCQLIACAKPDSLPVVFTEAPPQAVVPATATELPPSLTATETSVPMQEPALPPAFSTETLPVTPPNFEIEEEVAEISFDLTAAHAVYAYYRQEVGPLYNLPEANFIQEMSQYYKTTLEPNGIHLLQSLGDSAVYSLLTRGSQFFAYFTPEGVLADYAPGHWSKTGMGQWVEARGTNGPLELFIGEDGLAYIAQLGSNDDVVYRFFYPIGATLDNLDEQWIPVKDGQSTLTWDGEQGRWVEVERKLGPVETEFEGVFSEKYKPSFTDSFVFKDKESGLEIPISIGLTDDLPVKAAYLTNMGREFLGNFWLLSCYYRYTGTMGNKDVTMDQYLDMVKEGKGQIEVDYFDEISGEEKQALYNLTDGISLTATGNDQMPLSMTPKSSTYQIPYYFTVNKDGQFVLVRGLDLHYLDDLEEMCINKSKNLGYCFSDEIFISGLSAIMQWWAVLTPEQFTNKEITDLDPPIFSDFAQTNYYPFLRKLDKRTETKTPFVSVDYLNK